MNTTIASTSLRRLISPVLFGAFALSCSALSLAADRVEAYQTVVKYGDLNLSNAQGAHVLYSRIVSAARQVCDPFEFRDRNLGTHARVDACVHRAVKQAVTDVGQPELQAVYSANNHEPVPAIIASAQAR